MKISIAILLSILCFAPPSVGTDHSAELVVGPIFPEQRPQKKRSIDGARLHEGLNLEEVKARRRFGIELLVTAADHLADGLSAEGKSRETHLRAAGELLDALLAIEEAEEKVTAGGAGEAVNLRLSEIAWGSALRYRLRGDETDFLRAKRLLLEFAQEMPRWPVQLSNKRRRGVPQDTPRLATSHDSGGLWWRWYPLDLVEGTPLVYAYALIEPRLSTEERRTVNVGVFDTQLRLLGHWQEGFHNTLVYLIDGYISYGLALKRPELIHLAVRLIRDLIPAGYSPDGFWHEGSPAYHRQVEAKLRGSFRRLEGYSDPAGWKHPESGERFDQLSLQQEFISHISGTDQAWEKLTLPDGFLVAVNDTDPETYTGTPRKRTESALLGTSGYASLGSGQGDEQSQLFLNFKGTFGHEHQDVNGLHWYALGRRWFDETRYRPIRESGSERAWSASTAAHNTVVIDERSQPNRFREPHIESFGAVMAAYEKWPLRRVHAGSNHMGDLLLYDGRNEAVQVIEVEGKKAYPGVASLYRRTLVKVDLGGGEGYLVDIFRVRGGKRHDYMLHGALAQPYEFSTSAPIGALSGQLHRYITLSQGAEVKAPFEFSFTYADGAVSRSMVLAPEVGRMLVGEAPAINRLGQATWVNLRQDEGDSTFVVVHEARKGKARITAARLLTVPGKDEVAVEVRFGTRVDTILSTLSAEGRVTLAGENQVEMIGKLGIIRRGPDKVERAWLWDGRQLSVDGESLCESLYAAWEGEVVTSGEQLVIKGSGADEALRSGATLHADFGGLLTWSYRVKSVKPGELMAVTTEHYPGFVLHEDGGEMTRHPGWKFSGKVRVRVPVALHYQSPTKEEEL